MWCLQKKGEGLGLLVSALCCLVMDLLAVAVSIGKGRKKGPAWWSGVRGEKKKEGNRKLLFTAHIPSPLTRLLIGGPRPRSPCS
jgi:hypothetical protein